MTILTIFRGIEFEMWRDNLNDFRGGLLKMSASVTAYGLFFWKSLFFWPHPEGKPEGIPNAFIFFYFAVLFSVCFARFIMPSDWALSGVLAPRLCLYNQPSVRILLQFSIRCSNVL